MAEHIPGTVATSTGHEAKCSCGWRSGQTWPDTEEGHEQAHDAAHAHVAEAGEQ